MNVRSYIYACRHGGLYDCVSTYIYIESMHPRGIVMYVRACVRACMRRMFVFLNAKAGHAANCLTSGLIVGRIYVSMIISYYL